MDLFLKIPVKIKESIPLCLKTHRSLFFLLSSLSEGSSEGAVCNGNPPEIQ